MTSAVPGPQGRPQDRPQDRPQNRPQGSVLHVTAHGTRAWFDPETGIDLNDGRARAGAGNITAIILEVAPDSPALPQPVRRLLAGLTAHVPFFAVHSGDAGAPLERWAAANGSIFDRFIVAGPSEEGAGNDAPNDTANDRGNDRGPLLPLEIGPGVALLEAVFGDLRAEMTETHETEADYTPAGHWEARASRFGTSGRSVCYANAPRIINKMMHAIQIAALAPAIRRAAAAMKHGSAPPDLMEFGCGIGRLARTCRPHVRYHGADISRSMIDAARVLNPGTRFFTTQTLGRADLPPMDIVMTVTVLHHNDRAGRLKILKSAAELARERVRLIFLEDLMAPAQIKSPNMYPLSIESLQDEIATAFGGSCTQAGFRLIGYKPHDLLPRTGLIELDVWR
jgi:hypothetical protein